MKIRYQDFGTVSQMIISSTVLEIRKHNQILDMLYLADQYLVINTSGIFFLRSTVSGKTSHVLRAYKTAVRGAGQ
ncbi:TPA: hypothetical protein KMA24_004560 [Escherichia coli]|uniref:hypothetical protein n=1 Tax=Escherichia coli TaxID=562 RepID=UPI0015E8F05C|nr:hypothetical protein [Escherichia coli]EFH3308134.1 hypothetical protein [Escherichia coli]EJJ0958432.1 hypothetical protein [Escherichia coli]EJV8882873.1 hypothetical protein [Escherichia coli]MCV5585152.1 hypothetical protein [Escherichia coli]MDY5573539.1 hypothetical protein [Escherichia coli]